MYDCVNVTLAPFSPCLPSGPAGPWGPWRKEGKLRGIYGTFTLILLILMDSQKYLDKYLNQMMFRSITHSLPGGPVGPVSPVGPGDPWKKQLYKSSKHYKTCMQPTPEIILTGWPGSPSSPLSPEAPSKPCRARKQGHFLKQHENGNIWHE